MSGGVNRMNEGQDRGGDASRASDTASDLTKQAQETASHLAGQAREAASSISSAASAAVGKAREAMSQVGEKVSSMTGSLRDKAAEPLRSAAGAVSAQWEAGREYIREHDLSDMGQEVTNVIRRHPLPAILAAFGVGVLLGSALRR